AVLAGACGDDATPEGPADGAGGAGGAGGLVVATTSQIGALAREVVGDADVELHTRLRPDVNPHDYEPSAAESARVSGADPALRNGLGPDDFLDGILTGTGARNAITVTEGIPLRTAAGHDHADADHAEDDHAEDDHAEDDHA